HKYSRVPPDIRTSALQATLKLQIFTINWETYQTWYSPRGDLSCDKRPLVVLHGRRQGWPRASIYDDAL
ncbi:uncharacterized protein B0H18DRAFT_689694, partial [Fomitopsis serialis]|uniref:uncharacterized protein n=1 Tax=Fomitopsis serialis TaxID=139415 RepID=UPI0020085E58